MSHISFYTGLSTQTRLIRSTRHCFCFPRGTYCITIMINVTAVNANALLNSKSARDRTQVGRGRRHNARINGLPKDRGGRGLAQRTQGKFNIFRFSNVISLPLGHHYKSNSHPWGSQILLHVDTNFAELLKINTEVSEGEIKILKALLVFGQVSGFICMPHLE